MFKYNLLLNIFILLIKNIYNKVFLSLLILLIFFNYNFKL